MTYSPVNTRWLLSDTYPDSTTHERILFLYDMRTGLRHSLGSFYADPDLSKENRCDLHPRWSRMAPRSASTPCMKASGRCMCWTSHPSSARAVKPSSTAALALRRTATRPGGGLLIPPQGLHTIVTPL